MALLSDKTKGSIHHFSNGLMSRWGAAAIGAGVGYSFSYGATGAAGGLSALCVSFFIASSGAIASELTKAHENSIMPNPARDLRQQGITAILLIALSNGMVSASDYEEYQKSHQGAASSSQSATPRSNNP